MSGALSHSPALRALEAVAVANRSTKRPLNLLTMSKSVGASSAAGNSGATASSSTTGSSLSASAAYSFASSDASSMLPPNTRQSYAMEMRSLEFTSSIPNSEYFFFGSDEHSTFCILCKEDIEPPFTQRTHVAASSRASHTNHTCREVSLDHLALLSMRGYPLDHIYSVWSDVLLQHPLFPRITQLVTPRLLHSWEARAEALLPHLKLLCELKVLDLCLAGIVPQTVDTHQGRRRAAFERVEYIGDCAWGPHIANRIMLLFPNEQWAYSDRVYAFNCTKDAAEMNITLELLYDSLHLTELLPLRADFAGSGKIKADMVEAVMGELHCVVWGLMPEIEDTLPFVEINGEHEDSTLMLVQHCLSELYDLLVLGFARELSWNAIPLAKVLAAKNLWMETKPALRQHKASRRHWSRGRGGFSDNCFTSAGMNAPRRTCLNSSSLSSTAPFSFLSSVVSSPASGSNLTGSPTEQIVTAESVEAVSEQQSDSGKEAAVASSNDSPSKEATKEGSNDTSSQKAIPARGGASPVPLAVAAALWSRPVQNAQRFVLPGVPRLHNVVTPYPRHVPHPLRALENRPPHSSTESAPTSFLDRQRLTTVQFTGRDVFGAFHRSFESLRLLSDDTRQTHAMVLSHRTLQQACSELIPLLVPSLSSAVGDSSAPLPLHLLMHSRGELESGAVFFRDPYYHVSDSPASPGPLEEEDGKTLLGRRQGCVVMSKAAHADLSTSVLFDSFDSQKDNEAEGVAPLTVNAVRVRFAKDNAFPRLEDMSTYQPDQETSDSGVESSTNNKECINEKWQRSRWVPSSVKPPPTGVVTEQHTVYSGAFAYVGQGIRDPIRFAMKRMDESPTRKGGKQPKEEEVKSEEVSVSPQASSLNGNDPSGEGTTSVRSTESEGMRSSNIARDAKPEGPPENITVHAAEGVSATRDAAARETVNSSIHNQDGSENEEAKEGEEDMEQRTQVVITAEKRIQIWKFLAQRSKALWSQDNSFFPSRVPIGLGSKIAAPSSSTQEKK